MTPEKFVEERRAIRARIVDLQVGLDTTYEILKTSPFPEHTRPANHADMKVGAVLWYKDFDDGAGWQIVEEVLHPKSNWKAYVAEDGCRYGLDGAFVRVEK